MYALANSLKVWTIGLGIVAFGGILFTILRLITGNYAGTASFEF